MFSNIIIIDIKLYPNRARLEKHISDLSAKAVSCKVMADPSELDAYGFDIMFAHEQDLFATDDYEDKAGAIQEFKTQVLSRAHLYWVGTKGIRTPPTPKREELPEPARSSSYTEGVIENPLGNASDYIKRLDWREALDEWIEQRKEGFVPPLPVDLLTKGQLRNYLFLSTMDVLIQGFLAAHYYDPQTAPLPVKHALDRAAWTRHVKTDEGKEHAGLAASNAAMTTSNEWWKNLEQDMGKKITEELILKKLRDMWVGTDIPAYVGRFVGAVFNPVSPSPLEDVALEETAALAQKEIVKKLDEMTL